MPPHPDIPAPPNPLEIARSLAALLDAAKHDEASSLLARNCLYLIRGKTLRGADTIIASYDAAHADALATFDSIEYDSTTRPDESDPAKPNAAIIHYTDIITHRGITHTHQCEQRVTIDPGSDPPAHIVRIEHIDLPGEHDALNTFLAHVGLPKRPELGA